MKLILHTDTDAAINTFISHPTHALLLTGQAGSGKGTVAEHIVSSLLDIDPSRFTNAPHIMQLDAQEDGSIDSIRASQRFMQLKTPGERLYRRALIIEHAEQLSQEAQNAFLKLLEEPPSDSILVLTSENSRMLLPTIMSRLQRIPVLSPDLGSLLTNLGAQGHSPASIERAYYTSEGSVGLMQALLEKQSEHPLVEQIELAKTLLRAPLFERLSRVDELSKQKDSLPLLLQAIQRVSHAALLQAGQSNKTALIRRWHRTLQAVTTAQEQLRKNANAKLVLSDLLLSL